MASPLLVFLLKLLPYGLIWLLFILIYLVIPNTRVKFVSALIGGLIAGAIFQLIQGGYIHTQFLLSRYNAVYGSFAALPLFLIWMQLSWIIVLFGAQIAYAHQHVGLHAMAIDYDQSSPNLRKKYALYVFWALVGQFKAGAGAPTASELADQLDLPYGLIAQALDNLVQARLISSVIRDEVDDFGYQPARDINAVTLMHVLQALEAAGDNELPRQAAPALGRVSEAVENLSQAMFHSKRNTSVKDL